MRIPATFVLVFVAGCGLIGGKKGEDAGAPAETPPTDAIDAAAAVTAPGAPIGKNAANVARFQSETAVNEPKVIGQTATPRTSPGGGSIVATLKAGTTVTRIATNHSASLIVFPDPSAPADNLMGWVTEAAFSAAVVVRVDSGIVDSGTVAVVDAGPPAVVDAGKPAPNCKAGTSPVQIPPGSNWGCRKICTADKDCVKGTKKCETQNVYQPAAGAPTTVKACHDDN